MIQDRKTKEIINAFRFAVEKVQNTKNPDNQKLLKSLQMDFCYAVNEIETGPPYNIPSQLRQIEDLTEKVKGM